MDFILIKLNVNFDVSKFCQNAKLTMFIECKLVLSTG